MPDANNYQQLSAEELSRWMNEKRNFYLIDLLGGEHFGRVHLPDAVNACVFQVTFLDQIRAIAADRNAEIVLYGSSSSSMDAVKAAEKLVREGYRRIHLLEGGLQAWRAAGFAVEGEAADLPGDPQTLLKLDDRSYRIDTAKSSIEWAGRNPNTTHIGTIAIAAGELAVHGGIITGSFTLDMDSIANTNLAGDPLQPVLIAHLKSDDFFFSRLFPTAKYTILDATPIKEPFLSTPNYAIQGMLELRGVQARQDFMATVTATGKGLLAEAHFDLDRTRWDIIYGSTRYFEHLGMHLVFEPISIQLRLVAD